MIAPACKNKSHSTEVYFGISFVALYIVVRMIGDFFFWRNISEIYSYLFEVVFVLAAAWVYGHRVRFSARPKSQDALSLALAVCGGFAAYKFAGALGIIIPFDLSSNQTIFLLLVLAPILEESIFRFALWESIASFINNNRVVLALTTALFCAGHLAAYWFVPDTFKTFVLYQTTYVIALGLAAGWVKIRSQSMLSPVLVHFGFNLGFFIGSGALNS